MFRLPYHMGKPDDAKATLQELLNDIELSPRYTRSRERRWARAARKLLRSWNEPASSSG